MSSIRTRTGRNPLAGIGDKNLPKPEKITHALSEVEQETIITFNKTNDPAVIFTYDKAWIRHLKTKMMLGPVRDNGKGGFYFELDKTRIPKPRPRRIGKKMTAEQKVLAGERLKKARANR